MRLSELVQLSVGKWSRSFIEFLDPTNGGEFGGDVRGGVCHLSFGETGF